MNLRLMLLVLATLAFTSCRRVPEPSCVAGCDSAEQSCNYEGHPSWDREKACSKRKDECVKGCPTR